MRKLSSNLTLFWRFYAIGWILFFLVVGLIEIYKFLTASKHDFDAGKITFFILFGAIGGGFAYYLGGTLKDVFLDGDSLVVSNFLKRVRIPLSNVRHVDDPDLSSLRRIKVIFREPSEFGAEIVFAPPMFKAKKTAELLKLNVKK